MAWIRTNLTSAHVIAMLALFVALGGTGVAAVSLSKNSVGAKQIKKNAVRAAEINRNAVGASELRTNAVAGGDVADGGIGSLDIGDNAVGSGELSANSVGSGELADNSVGSSEVASGAVGSDEVADGSLTSADLVPGTGAFPTAYARIRSDGVLEGGAAQSKGIEQSMVQHENTPATADANTSPTGPGVYCFGGLGFTPNSVTVSLDNTDSMPAIGSLTGGSLNFIATAALFKGEDLGRCNSAHGQVRVAIEQVDQTNPPTLANHGFFIQFHG